MLIYNIVYITKPTITQHTHERYLVCKDINNMLVKEIMTLNPISVNKEMLAAKALSLMNSKKITSLCVHDNKSKKKTIGVLHIHNVLAANIQ